MLHVLHIVGIHFLLLFAETKSLTLIVLLHMSSSIFGVFVICRHIATNLAGRPSRLAKQDSSESGAAHRKLVLIAKLTLT